MKRTNPVLGALFANLAFLANIATIVVIYRMYRFGEIGVHYAGIPGQSPGEISYLVGALIALPALMVLNIISARTRPGNWFFRWLIDFLPSLALLVTATTVLALSLFTTIRPPQELGNLLLFGGLVLWGLGDVFYNQRENVNDILAGHPAGSELQVVAPGDMDAHDVAQKYVNSIKPEGGFPPDHEPEIVDSKTGLPRRVTVQDDVVLHRVKHVFVDGGEDPRIRQRLGHVHEDVIELGPHDYVVEETVHHDDEPPAPPPTPGDKPADEKPTIN